MVRSAVVIAVSLGGLVAGGGCLRAPPSTPVAWPGDPHHFVTDVHLRGEALSISRCDLVYGFSTSFLGALAGDKESEIHLATTGCETVELPLPPGIDPVGPDGDLDRRAAGARPR